MKTLFTLFSISYLFISSINTEKNSTVSITDKTDYAVFDGSEGDLLFFTNNKDEAITIEDEGKILFKSYEKQPNDYVGEKFKISIKDDVDKNNVYNAKSILKLEIDK